MGWRTALYVLVALLAAGPAAAQTGTAQVDRVIPGDTIRVRLDGARYTVRFTGVDTTETTHPTRGVEPYGRVRARYRCLVGACPNLTSWGWALMRQNRVQI